jgi:hypothetical protein
MVVGHNAAAVFQTTPLVCLSRMATATQSMIETG